MDWISSSNQPDSARSLGHLVDVAFNEKDECTFRLVICVALWVVLSQRFWLEKVDLETS